MNKRDVIVWPDALNTPTSVKFNLSAATITPGQTASGAFPYGRLDGGGLWTATLNQVNFDETNADLVRLWRAMRSLCQNGLVPIAVPRLDPRVPPWPVVLGSLLTAYPVVKFGDASLFSDGSGFYQPVIDCVTVGSSARRSTTLPVNFNYGGPPRGGECFTIDHDAEGLRMYEVTTVATAVGSSDLTIGISPPLREAVGAAVRLDFDRVRCTMRLAKPGEMDYEFSTWPLSRPTVNFVETFFDS